MLCAAMGMIESGDDFEICQADAAQCLRNLDAAEIGDSPCQVCGRLADRIWSQVVESQTKTELESIDLSDDDFGVTNDFTADLAPGDRDGHSSAADSVENETQEERLPLVGNYQIQSRLGEGGMGTIYRARHVKLNKDVAFKILRRRRSFNPGLANARFDQELQAIGALDHPNVVRALDAGEFEGIAFLSMELLEGIDLEKLIGDDKRLKPEDACEIIRQTALGMQYIHNQGLVHRDIKPANLMLTLDSLQSPCVKILDLGLAVGESELPDDRLTGDGIALGTCRYMSPEQATDTKTVNHLGDIYSLGATFYRLLTGRPHFPNPPYKSISAILLAITTVDPPKIETVKPDLPPQVSAIVNRMLSRDQKQRPQDLIEVAAAIEPFAREHQLKMLLREGLSVQVNAQKKVAKLDARIRQLATVREDRKPAASVEAVDEELDDIEVLRQRVKKFWVDGVLKRTEETTDLVSLRREMVPDAVINPWEGVTEIPLTSTDAARPIEELYEDSERSLLVLGDPGAGKSTLLLMLTRALLTQGNSRGSGGVAPVPVVLHLSTWGRNTASLGQWIEKELSAKYQIPRQLGGQFVEDNQLILLLDGLDEVRADAQAACVTAINVFLENFSPPGIVVSSRAEDYKGISARLKLHGAVRLEPLTPKQILASLSAEQTNVHPLLRSLEKQDAMMDLAKSPLMLNVMKQTFEDSTDDSFAQIDTVETARDHVFGVFVDRMFRSKGKTDQGFSKQETLTWLGWLAKQMNQRSQSVFLVEDLQPDWLATTKQRALYAVALSFGLGLALALATFGFWYHSVQIMDFASKTVFSSMAWFFVQIPIWLMLVVGLDFVLFSKPQGLQGKIRQTMRGVLKSLLYLVLWLLWPLVGWACGRWGTGWIICNILAGAVIAPMMGMMGRDKRVFADIGTVEALSVSPIKSFQGWLWGLLVGYVVYQSYLWLWALYLLDEPPEWFPYYWRNQEEVFVSLAWPLLGGAVGLVVGGLVPYVRKGNATPNQGMKMSLRNALISAGFSSVVVAATVFLTLYFWIKLPGMSPLDRSLFLGIIFGFTGWASFFVALNFGLLDWAKHFLTRRILTINRQIPNDFLGFLKHASRLSFLKRAGGAFIFSHRMLLEYFASEAKHNE